MQLLEAGEMPLGLRDKFEYIKLLIIEGNTVSKRKKGAVALHVAKRRKKQNTLFMPSPSKKKLENAQVKE